MRVESFLAFAVACASCGGSREPRVAVAPAAATETRITDAHVDGPQHGLATWYGGAFAGRPTANGERFDPKGYTAAHRTLPFGTWVEVRRIDNGKTVRVRINDRGPWGHAKRIIDLSERAASDIDLVAAGVTRVEVRVLSTPR
jgi:rare lipoprotein A